MQRDWSQQLPQLVDSAHREPTVTDANKEAAESRLNYILRIGPPGEFSRKAAGGQPSEPTGVPLK